MNEMTDAGIRVEAQSGIGRGEAHTLALETGAVWVLQLRRLTASDWRQSTVCAPWTVKDIVAHVLGWCEALTSTRELAHQVRSAIPRVKELGNLVDAQNQVQVDERAHLTPDQLVERLEIKLLAAARRRRALGALHYVPFYVGYLGGMINLGYVANVIFLRDHLVHRIDIARATGSDPLLGPADRRLIADMLKDWGRRSGAELTVDLTGSAGGQYVIGDGSGGAITAEAADFVHLLSGRTDQSVVQVHRGDDRVQRWLSIRCPV